VASIEMGLNTGAIKTSIIKEKIKFVKFMEKNSLGIRAARYEKITSKPPTITRKIIYDIHKFCWYNLTIKKLEIVWIIRLKIIMRGCL
jgi:hypothetical protein